MKKLTLAIFAIFTLPVALTWPTSAFAMEVDVRVPFVVMSGPITGNELRLLQDAVDNSPGITTVVLKNSHGGNAKAGYAVGEYIREKGLNTAVSGYCTSSCSRMFLGGNSRSFSDDQALDQTYVGFHGNYASDGSLIKARVPILKEWIIKYSDGKANPLLVEQWVNLENRKGYAYFYHPQANLDLGPDRVILCQGSEGARSRVSSCAKPGLGGALSNGILTSSELVKMSVVNAVAKP